jgi:DNA-binding transcriptional regulator YiaG
MAEDGRRLGSRRWTAEAIRNLRERAGLSERVFAQALEVSPMAVIEWERGGRKPNRVYTANLDAFAARLEEADGCGDG